jgi:PAS domain S-box-containing protein
LGSLVKYFDWYASEIILSVTLPIIVSWYLSRIGYWQPGSYLAPALIFFLGVYGSWQGGLVGTSLIFYILAILLVSMLRGGKTQWAVLVISILTHFLVVFIRGETWSEDAIPTLITVSGSFIGVSLLQWFSINQLQQALGHVHAAARKLQLEVEERQVIEIELRGSEAKFRSIIEESAEGIVLADEEGRIVEWNKTQEALTGLPRHQVVGQVSWDVAAQVTSQPENVSLFRTMVLYYINRGEAPDNQPRMEVTYHHVDGSQRIVEQVIFPIKVEHGYRIGMISSDITQKKNIEQEREELILELEKKNNELMRFAYTVSHDLKSPLISVESFLGYLERDLAVADTQKVVEDIGFIRNVTTLMSRLLDDILKLSRAGHITNAQRWIPFTEIVNEALELVHGRMVERGVKSSIAVDLPIVVGDRIRLVEVVQNLLENSIKFMGDQPQPEVEIGCRGKDEKGRWVIYIKDNGIGIDSKHYNMIFEPFFRLNNTTEGTGIGLALVAMIIESHGGRIWVESEGVSFGSTFFFTLAASSDQK